MVQKKYIKPMSRVGVLKSLLLIKIIFLWVLPLYTTMEYITNKEDYHTQILQYLGK